MKAKRVTKKCEYNSFRFPSKNPIKKRKKKKDRSKNIMIVLFISNSSLSYVTFFSTFSATLLKPSIPKIEKKYIYMVVVKT